MTGAFDYSCCFDKSPDPQNVPEVVEKVIYQLHSKIANVELTLRVLSLTKSNTLSVSLTLVILL